MEAHAETIVLVMLLAYVLLIYIAVRWFMKDDPDTVDDADSRWMLDDFYIQKKQK